jgi:hypothetical protein
MVQYFLSQRNNTNRLISQKIIGRTAPLVYEYVVYYPSNYKLPSYNELELVAKVYVTTGANDLGPA